MPVVPYNYFTCDADSLSLINKFNKKYLVNNLTTHKLLAHTKIIIDSGATGHYFSDKLLPLLTKVQPYTKFSIRLPDGSRIKSTHIGYFVIAGLPEAACMAYLFHGLTVSLLSVGQFCASGCEATFDQANFRLKYGGKVIYEGYQQRNLWLAPFPSAATPKGATQPPQNDDGNFEHSVDLTTNEALVSKSNDSAHINSLLLVYPIASKSQRMLFYQRVLCHPAKSTLLKAIRDFNPFKTWPELTRELVTKYYRLTEETVFGRLDRTRKNWRSTKPNEVIHTAPDMRVYPNSPKNPRCLTKTHMIYTDISGIIQKKYYFLALFFEDINYIMLEWLGTSKSGATYRTAYERALDRYAATPGGMDNQPHFEMLDNAADSITRDMLNRRQISFQFVTITDVIKQSGS